MRKIIGYIQLLIFILIGFWLISFKFQSATSYDDVYWIAGVVYLLLAAILFLVGNKYGWFIEVDDKSDSKGGSSSGFTIPFVFVIGVVNFLKSKNEILNIDTVLPFVLLIIPLATILGYAGFLAQSSMRPSQFRGTLYKKMLVPMLYLGSFFLAFSLLTSGNNNLPSTHNETRTYDLLNNDCKSDYISIVTDTGVRNLYNPKQIKSKVCVEATKVKATLQMNQLGIDYFSEFEYLK